MDFNTAIENTRQYTTTDNGDVTLQTSNNALLDMFFTAGAMRGAEDDLKISTAMKAISQDVTLFFKTLFWMRDVRGGIGERNTFRVIVKSLAKSPKYKEQLKKLINLIPMYGRWDDLLVFIDDDIPNDVQDLVIKTIKAELLANKDDVTLCAKWMPRKGVLAAKLRSKLGFTPKQYRKTLVNQTKVVESKMCEGKWNEIDYSKLPSLASLRYQNAFKRHDEARYESYVDDVVEGDAKVNTSTLQPHNLTLALKNGNVKLINEQWNQLEDYLGDAKLIPMIDVSGSMYTEISPNLQAIDVSISLGLYTATRLKGGFNGCWLEFSSEARLHTLPKEDLDVLVKHLDGANWGMSTNFDNALDSILQVAIQNELKQDDMPDYLIVFSDMQFDCGGSGNKTASQRAKAKFESHGYKVPIMIWWNLDADSTRTPVTFDKKGNVLVSGFSPVLMKSILKVDLDKVSPKAIWLETINQDRYNIIGDLLDE